jgi:hypothetical protein
VFEGMIKDNILCLLKTQSVRKLELWLL